MKLQVILPIGPGHEQTARRAKDSVQIAMLTDMGRFDSVEVISVDDTKGEMGRSAARNFGVSKADADWLFFLDADDLMHPDALDSFTRTNWLRLDAVFGLTTQLEDGHILTRYQLPVINDYETLISFDPFLTVKMGHFVRREVAQALPFNTDMDCGEDWEYYLRLWKNYRCVKENYPLFIKVRGQHSQGPRSATGAQWNVAVNALIKEARDEWTRTRPTSP